MLTTTHNKRLLLKRQLENPSERSPEKKPARKYQIALYESTLTKSSRRKQYIDAWMDAEAWKWLLVEGGPHSDKTLRQVARTLKPIRNIQTLYLIHWGSYITDSGLYYLCKSMKRYENLRNLFLGFTACRPITDKGLHYVGQSLKRLPHLEVLTLDFARCSQITGEGVLGLSKCLKTLVCLRKITLNIAMSQIKDYWIKNLSKGIKRLKRLESITLDFSHSSDITDKGLESIGEMLKRHKKLQTVSLRFLNCRGLTDIGLKYLSEGLESLVFLEEVILRFSWCERMTDVGLESVVGSLRKLAELRQVDFWFLDCFKITKEREEKAQEALKEVKSVKLKIPIQNVRQARRYDELEAKRMRNRTLIFGLLFVLIVLIFTYFVKNKL